MESGNSKAPKTGHANDSDRLLCFAFTSTIASVDSTQMVDMRIEGCATYAAAVAIDRGPVPLDQSRIGISLLSCLLIAIAGGGVRTRWCATSAHPIGDPSPWLHRRSWHWVCSSLPPRVIETYWCTTFTHPRHALDLRPWRGRRSCFGRPVEPFEGLRWLLRSGSCVHDVDGFHHRL
jgi:hypothetical protein